MSDDIVKEIREARIALPSTARKAADEIEKLREELDSYDDKTKELCDEITRLRADLAAVTAERDRMREVVKRADSYIHNGIELGFIRHCDTPEDPAYHTPRIVREAARAAIESVTEPPTGDSNA